MEYFVKWKGYRNQIACSSHLPYRCQVLILYPTTQQQFHFFLPDRHNIIEIDEIHLKERYHSGLKEIRYPVSLFNIEEWVGNFTVDVTNGENIENGLLLFSDKTSGKAETCLVNMQYKLHK